MSKNYTDSKVTFDIKMPGYDGSYAADPHKIDYVQVHYVERERAKESDKHYASPVHDHPIYYDSLGLIVSFAPNDMVNVSKGKYRIDWQTNGMREGDYFVSWKWKPVDNGKSLYAYQKFYLNSGLVPGKPGKEAQRDKYEILISKYLPETYKNKIFDKDLTPYVIGGLNKAVGAGFLMLEDLANKAIDILDANTTHQAVLPLLANMFNLKLKSDDVTKWRRQIKNAMSLFKKKGTYGGLHEALEQAGVKLKKLTILWQIMPLHTWTDCWLVDDEESLVFPLSKFPLPLDDNFELSIRPAGHKTYFKVPHSLGAILELDVGKHVLAWIGHTQPEQLKLFRGDRLRLTYKHRNMNPVEQEMENYIKSLPMADGRDESEQMYPVKNWNARLIEEDDPMFDVIVPERHPFHEPVIYGQVRSTFLYSEKVYNMDAYNGSLKNSTNPNDIDKNFVDNCGYCRTSKFNVDVEIEGLSNDRIIEVKDIIEEYSPFHAVLHSLNVSGLVSEYILPPIERIKVEIEYRNRQKVVFDNVLSPPMPPPPTGTDQVDVIQVKESIICVIQRRDGTIEKKELI